MSIYLELLERVENGESFYVDFEKRTIKVGRDFLIKNGEYDYSKELLGVLYGEPYDIESILKVIKQLYMNYKYSLPSERSDSKRKKYFKALTINELTDEELIRANRRESAQAALEGYILCSILSNYLTWNEDIMNGKWFWQSLDDPDLVILRKWIENK